MNRRTKKRIRRPRIVKAVYGANLHDKYVTYKLTLRLLYFSYHDFLEAAGKEVSEDELNKYENYLFGAYPTATTEETEHMVWLIKQEIHDNIEDGKFKEFPNSVRYAYLGQIERAKAMTFFDRYTYSVSNESLVAIEILMRILYKEKKRLLSGQAMSYTMSDSDVVFLEKLYTDSEAIIDMVLFNEEKEVLRPIIREAKKRLQEMKGDKNE